MVRINSAGLESTHRAREKRLQREGAAWIQRTAWKESPQHKHGGLWPRGRERAMYTVQFSISCWDKRPWKKPEGHGWLHSPPRHLVTSSWQGQWGCVYPTSFLFLKASGAIPHPGMSLLFLRLHTLWGLLPVSPHICHLILLVLGLEGTSLTSRDSRSRFDALPIHSLSEHVVAPPTFLSHQLITTGRELRKITLNKCV